jgi:hypothetical protein
LLLWIAAYQYKQDYVVRIADRAFHPYISNFNDIETTSSEPPLTYRWSTGHSQIFLPGIGNEPVLLSITTIGSRPAGPPPEITLGARGQTFKLQTESGEKTDTLLVPRGDAWDGDFALQVDVPSFTPPGDPRELGVIIREVDVKPADYSLRPVVVPSKSTLGTLLVGMLGAYFLCLITTRSRATAFLVLSSAIAVSALGIVLARPETAYLAGQLPMLFGWGLLLAILGRALLDVVLSPDDKWSSFVVGAGSTAFAVAFMVRFGGLTYAQFLTSDLLLHVHNTESVLRGEWLFTEAVPDGTQVPYPPAQYVLVGALSWLVGGSEEMLGLLLKWTASLLDAICCLGLAWAGTRLHRGAWGGMAALAYAASPAAFDLFSAGNYTNIFAQSVLNFTLLGALVFLGRPSAGNNWFMPTWLAAGFFLTMLGHYGMMLGTLPIVAFFAIWTFTSYLRRTPARRAIVLLGAWLVAMAASVGFYYWHFAGEISTQFGRVLGKLSGQPTTPPAEGGTSFARGLARLPAKVYDLVGGLAVISGAAGVVGLSRTSSAARALLWCWLLAALIFALLDQVVGDSVRWYYMAAAPVSLLAGRFLTALVVRVGVARTLAWIVLGAMALNMLVFWTGLIFLRYH